MIVDEAVFNGRPMMLFALAQSFVFREIWLDENTSVLGDRVRVSMAIESNDHHLHAKRNEIVYVRLSDYQAAQMRPDIGRVVMEFYDIQDIHNRVLIAATTRVEGDRCDVDMVHDSPLNDVESDLVEKLIEYINSTTWSIWKKSNAP